MVDTRYRKTRGWTGSYITTKFWRDALRILAREAPPTDFHNVVALEDDHIHLESVPSQTGGSWAIALNAPPRGRYPTEVAVSHGPTALVARVVKRNQR